MAVSGVVIHAPPNALPLSALLFLLTSLVISSPPICAFLPPHPYCLSSLSLPPYTPITPLHVRSLSAFSVLFCRLSLVPPLPFILFPRPFSPFSVLSRPSGSPFPLLVPAVNFVSDTRLDNTQRRPFHLNVSLCRAPMSPSPGCCYHTCCSVRLLPVK